MAIVISGVNNNDKITSSDGTIDLLSGVNYVGVITAPAIQSSGNITASGNVSGVNITSSNNLTAANINVGSNIQFGNAGIITATTLIGNVTGNVNHTSNLLLQISGSEKLRIANSGAFGLNGTNYGSSGQVLTSQGSGSSPTWSTVSGTTINNNADNRIITGSGTANTLNGEANLTFDGAHLQFANGKGIRTNFIRPTTSGNTNTGGASQQYWKLGEISLNGSEAAEITLLGANGYSSGNTQVYGKTTIILRGSNGNTLLGSWWVEGGQGGHYQDVRWKYISGTNYELWVSAGNFNNIAPFVKATGTFDQTNAAGTGSNTAPSGSTALPQTHYKTVGSINTIEYTNTHTRYLRNIKMDSGYGIDFSATSDATHTGASGANPTTDSEVLTDYEHGTWTPRLRAYDHAGGAGWGTMKYTDGTDVIGSGRYVRIGNYVWAGFKFESGSKVFDSNWTYWSIDNTPYGANHYDKASGSLYVSQTNFFTDSNSHIGGFVHGNESYMVVNKPDGHANATINSSNNNRYCYGHIAIYTSRT